MAQETLKITITADNKQAVQNIQETVTATTQMGTAFNKVPASTAQATNALVNLSRVAQDAPYGFIGIANNLNPLLESFQRLQVQAKETGTSLTKLIGGALTGPAGIGVALGIVSSIMVAFGDDIKKFIDESVHGLGEAFEMESSLITKSADGYVKAKTDIDKLKDSYNDFQNGFITKDKFLKQFNATLGDTIASTNDLATAEKFLTDSADDYVNMVFKKSVANLAAAEAAKKQFEAEISRAKPKEAFKEAFDFTTVFYGGTIDDISKISGVRRQNIINEAEKDVTIFDSIRRKYEAEANKIQEALTKIYGASTGEKGIKKIPKAKEEKDIDVTAELRARYQRDTLLAPMEVAPKDTAIEDAKKQHENYLKWLTDWTKRKEKIAIENINKEQKDLEKLNAEYEKFATTVSETVTSSLFGMFDAMQQGQSATQALQEMFGRLLRQMAEMVIKAAIFAGIMSLISGGAAGGGVSFMGAFTKVLGFPKLADGGITTGPTMAMIGEGNENEAVLPLSKLGSMMKSTFNAGAMSGNGLAQNGQFVLKGNDLVLALQRSNYSLNLRRG